MLSKEEKEIYSRHLLLAEVGIEGQEKLKQAKVLVIGAGGLGCPVLQYLCAAGVGRIGIADHDKVEKSNLQRQILFGHSSIGKYKVDEAKSKLQDLNPFTTIDVWKEGITKSNAKALIANYDVVVDCTDNYPTRYLVNDACYLFNKPYVYGAIHKFEGQVSVFNYNNGPTYRCLYPNTPTQASITNCSESGVIGVLPGIIGTLQSNEVIKLITGIGDVLNGRILLYNSLKNTFNEFKIEKKASKFYANLDKTKSLESADYQESCSNEVSQLFKNIQSDFEQIIDVREKNELPSLHEITTINIPLNEVENRLDEIDLSKKTIVICQSGIRSQKAIEVIQTHGSIEKIQNLEGGINSLLVNI